MPTKIRTSGRFDKEVKHLLRKFGQLKNELKSLSLQLASDDRPGDKIPSVGYDTYKVRLRNPSAGKGKSGGFRVIYYVHVADQVFLLTIYSKSDVTDIPANEIKRIIVEVLGDETGLDKDESE